MESKMRFTRVITTALITIILVSCTSYQPPKEYTFEQEKTYNQTYDQVWSKLLVFLSELGSPIKHLDKNSGFINTEFDVPSNMFNQLMDCGVPADNLATNRFENPIGRFNIVVTKINDNETKVRVNSTLRCIYNSYMYENFRWQLIGSSAVNCSSKGELERSLLYYLSE
jgi:hypothetical protein